MTDGEAWLRTLSRPLFNLTRIVRSTRQPLETFCVDAALLCRCAQDQQAILIDRCDVARIVGLLDDAGAAIGDGLIWVVTGTDGEHRRIRAEAERRQARHAVFDGHPKFLQPNGWANEGLSIYLSSATELRAPGERNPRRRKDVMDVFCPLFVVVDSDLALCTVPFGTTFDPAWAVRDAIARLRAVQRMLPLLILTGRDLATINPSSVQRAFGMSGLLYAELAGKSAEESCSGGP